MKDKWSIKSKRFFLVLVVIAVWIATLLTKDALFVQLTPWVFGLLGGYMGFESWKPTGT